MKLTELAKLVKTNDSKIVLLVLDGLGGLPMEEGGQTELEAAQTPHLDRLAERSICGLHESIAPGVSPGSGPAHLALFGYDPIEHQVGRGVLAALGIDFDLQDGDVAARGNFCTIDEEGKVTDRRAGRISSETGEELCNLLQEQVEIEGVQVFVRPVKEYRFLLVLRGEGLASGIEDTDPQETGKAPLDVTPTSSEAKKTAELVTEFVRQAREILADRAPANMLLLRGFAQLPRWPQVGEAFGLKAAAIAGYPMYRGVAKLVGMDVLETSSDLDEEFAVLEKHWDQYDFFFVHVKPIDSAGEDGDFDRKVSLIENVDTYIPRLLALEPSVLVVTGDHSTPARLKAHSWHPIPVMILSSVCRPDGVTSFAERACMSGGLGPRIPAKALMPIALANAGRLEKFGA